MLDGGRWREEGTGRGIIIFSVALLYIFHFNISLFFSSF